ncbi:NAD(P)H-hydrate dehydratase [Streptococcus pseudoporcinus]|uniref:ADP-dependent (S)-NAD(P)H-hydrate dehydratase n=1 Tax=Streptococcus pseudoporcinus TaxID=361101 RepID=A0A4U9XIG3_9STRE|nr:NAD(P)H-hydrate dehydratase [Streptococcus pseudoporcinus]VTS12759.1 carbohydrate kinase family protein [Streptococcus pseudoporcinus]VUC65543.1 carbohydrate kinase family protein [Streptococcus pseudoporcinus]VUC96464.1 carbohydrate kinase family protein [Streptococcus pseudoporcinus]VUC96857.1 carbohydrate kinase family protein [Streptococcus pseudoporcinus]
MIISQEFLRQVITERKRASHKGDYGRLLLIGGLYPYGGAIIMAAKAAVYSGAGLVTVATEKDNIGPLHAQLPEAMAFSVDDQDLFLHHIRAAEIILIGSGLSENSKAETLFDTVMKEVSEEQVLILDGSALNLMAKGEKQVKKGQNLVLTPHQKEWERLSGLAIENQNLQTNREALRRFPDSTLLVAKSHATNIFYQDQIFQIDAGGPYQATGGMGDTLAGIIAGFSGQFPDVRLAQRVAAATYLHSYIADQLARDNYVVLPSVICEQIPYWMKKWC